MVIDCASRDVHPKSELDYHLCEFRRYHVYRRYRPVIVFSVSLYAIGKDRRSNKSIFRTGRLHFHGSATPGSRKPAAPCGSLHARGQAPARGPRHTGGGGSRDAARGMAGGLSRVPELS